MLDLAEEQLPGRIKATWIAPLFDLTLEIWKGEKYGKLVSRTS